MSLESVSVLRVVLLAAVVSLGMPGFAGDAAVAVTSKTAFNAGPTETVDKSLEIGTAAVRVKLAGGAAYVAVTKGSVDLTYADGSAMTTVATGTVLKVDGFIQPGSRVVANLAGGKAVLSLGAAAGFNLQSNSKGSDLNVKTADSTTPVVLAAGKSIAVNAPATYFTAGQNVTLKENQVGRVSGGDNTFVAIGTATGLAVTTQSASATLIGMGGDQVILSKGAVLTINEGGLSATVMAVSLTGVKPQLICTSGNIQLARGGKTTACPVGSVIGSPAAATAPAAAPVATATNAEPEVETVETDPADQKILDELDAWNAAK